MAWPRKQRWGPVWSASGLVGVVVGKVVPEVVVVHEVVKRVQKHPLLDSLVRENLYLAHPRAALQLKHNLLRPRAVPRCLPPIDERRVDL